MSDTLDEWVKNAPDYYDMTRAYAALGRFRGLVLQKERELDRISEQVALEEDKPRSNAARARKIELSSTLLDELTELKVELASLEAYVKALEFRKSMFASAAYTIKLRYEAPLGENT